MDYGPFGVRFLFFNTKKERRSIDELLIYFATPPFYIFHNLVGSKQLPEIQNVCLQFFFRSIHIT